MKKIFRRTAALLLSAVMLAVPAAAVIPVEYWQYHQPFNDACSTGDNENILSIGKRSRKSC